MTTRQTIIAAIMLGLAFGLLWFIVTADRAYWSELIFPTVKHGSH